ncbi:YaiI/YqxD family protein [Crassaminicella thermophila]|uniref:UPF0178 protein FQB35_08130 n=1 Tax=Crassaminicella thermophila TaxID=2599308 RepID=A0A5C0SCT8_CRATE|nr:DUF188 domain-containing protein [Crassaminicella thermophila]QEK12345.1 YaiI/YqxD family protein [Crassaminicella thermophila]
MTIYVDGDACSVKGLIVDHASKYNIKVVIVVSICHIPKQESGIKYIVVDNISQAVDMAIINMAKKNDIVVSDDYGLASVLLMKKVFCLSNRGLIYTLDNIDNLMFRRYMNMKIRRKGGKIKGFSKHSKKDEIQFVKSLNKVIKQSLYNSNI